MTEASRVDLLAITILDERQAAILDPQVIACFLSNI